MMKYTQLGSTDIKISRVSYGGIVSAGFYDNVLYPSEGQEASDRYVAWALDPGVNRSTRTKNLNSELPR